MGLPQKQTELHCASEPIANLTSMSTETSVKMERFSSTTTQTLLQQIQTRKETKENNYIFNRNAIKHATKKAINELKMQEEFLLDKLWKKNRTELAQLQKCYKEIKSKLTELIKIRETVRSHCYNGQYIANVASESIEMQKNLQVQVEREILSLAKEGKAVLQNTENNFIFEHDDNIYNIGHLEESKTEGYGVYANVLPPRSPQRQRSNTIVAIPDIPINSGKSTLRKARSTSDIHLSAKTMSMAFQMSNEDLCSLSHEENNSNSELNVKTCFFINQQGKALGQLHGPRDSTFLPNGNLLVTEYDNERIQVFDVETGVAQKLLQSVSLKPCGIAMTKDGYISVVDQKDNTIKILTRSGEMVCQFGTGYFKDLSFIALDSKDNYIVIDNMGAWQQCVFAYNAMTGVKTRLGYNKEGTYVLNHPEYITIDKHDNIVISDSGNHCVWVFDKRRNLKFKFGQQGDNEGDLNYPKGVSITQQNHFLVADCANHRICQFDNHGIFVKSVLTKEDGLDYPQVVQCKDENIVVVQNTGIIICKL